jgi:hypothetical protein
MPLAFDSLSHGSIAFGFFNIDSDMLLLDRYFFFSTDFCEQISRIVESDEGGSFKTSWQVYYIEEPEDIGDLMGAIHGIHYQGFMGELYRRFPFPERPEDFKQKPEGVKTRAIVEDMIAKYAEYIEIPFITDKEAQGVEIGAYRFSRPSFHELIKYVWRGGYPRWKDEVKPDYVLAMKREIEQKKIGLFEGIFFIDPPSDCHA